MKNFWNYLGQVRIYSLVDLILLLVAVRASEQQLVGAIFLHLGFLAYLEYCHAHAYRRAVPLWLPVILSLIGVYLFSHLAAICFLVFSFLYSLKNKKRFGLVSPIMRGFQNLALVAGIVGSVTNIAWLVFGLLTVRNFLGDVRDAKKDRLEGIMTSAVLLGFKKNYRYIHLAFLMLTTFVWWHLAGLSVGILAGVWIIEIITYNLTPR